ncbi:hypothetical protein [Actinoplanes sp. NPDC051494]|uniref:hypothetical protein n=1 Tax=Actinoplanes sp. NPDC051494 TaxID=3363907 RepID=UPI0037BC4CE7
MTTAVQPSAMPIRSPGTGMETGVASRYLAPMTSVDSVIKAIDINRPGLSDTKRKLLLFFAQGHYLARGHGALFAEALYATDDGVDLDDLLESEAPEPPHSTALNTINAVLLRYGDLSPADLRTLVQASQPWRLARKSTSSPRIEWAWLTDWFLRPEETDDPDDGRPTNTQLAAWAARRST